MKDFFGFHIWTLILFLGILNEKSADTLHLIDSSYSMTLENIMRVYKDSTGKQSFTQVLQSYIAGEFKVEHTPIPGYGFTKSAFWVQIPLANSSLVTIPYSLEVADAYTSEVSFFHYKNGTVMKTRTGAAYPFRERPFSTRTFLYYTDIKPQTETSVFIRIASKSSIELPIIFHCKNAFYKKQFKEEYLLGLFYGIVAVFVIIAFVLFIVNKDLNFLYFAGFLFTTSSAQATLDGYTFMYIWPWSPMINHNSFNVFTILAVTLSLIFSRRFLIQKKDSSLLPVLGKVVILANVLLLAGSLLPFPFSVGPVVNVTVLISILYVCTLALYSHFNRNLPARYYLIAWVVYLLFIVIRVMSCSGVLPYTSFTPYTIHVGLILHVVIVAFALWKRLQIVQKKHEQIQFQMMELRFKALQAQIRPHFLFNILNSIASLIVDNSEKAENALLLLTEFYREVLHNSSKSIITLREEISVVDHYLQLETIKFGRRLSYTVEIEPECLNVYIPFMTIQLLVENSIKHGIHPSIHGGEIIIRCVRTNKRYCRLTVEDTGVGLRENNSGSGYGLPNLKSRLEIAFKDYTFEMTDKRTGNPSGESGIKTTICFPMTTEPELGCYQLRETFEPVFTS